MEVWTDVGFLLINFLSQPKLKVILLSFFGNRKSQGAVLYQAAITWLCDFGQVA